MKLYKYLEQNVIFFAIFLAIFFIVLYANTIFILCKKWYIRKNTLEFFNSKYNLNILDVYDKNPIYSPSSLELDKNTDFCAIVKCERFNEDINKKFNLKTFNMLYVNDPHYIKYGFDYLINFCKASPSKIGIVSITENNILGLEGIEKHLPFFINLGIPTKNILIREDVNDAYIKGEGDGYWRDPIKSNIQFPSFSVHYMLETNTNKDINNYKNDSEWIEIGEFVRLHAFGMGMERIEYVFYNIPYPKK